MNVLLELLILFVAVIAARTQHPLVDQSNPQSISTSHASLPIVTLPYERHQAIYDVLSLLM